MSKRTNTGAYEPCWKVEWHEKRTAELERLERYEAALKKISEDGQHSRLVQIAKEALATLPKEDK